MKTTIILFVSVLQISFASDPALKKPESDKAESIVDDKILIPHQNGLKDLDEKVSKMPPKDKIIAYIAAAEKTSKIYSKDLEKNRPIVSMNLSPGLGYESGVSPESIDDPAVRKAYEKALADNVANSKALQTQVHAERTLDGLAFRIVKILDNVPFADADKKSFKTKLEGSSVPERFTNAVKKSKIFEVKPQAK